MPAVTLDSNWGTGAAATLDSGSNDTRGGILVSTGSSGPFSNASVLTFALDNPLQTVPFVLVVLAGADLYQNFGYTVCTKGFTVTMTELTFANTFYHFFYSVIP